MFAIGDVFVNIFKSLVTSVLPQQNKSELFSIDELNDKAEMIKDEIEKLKYKTLDTEAHLDFSKIQDVNKTLEQLKK